MNTFRKLTYFAVVFALLLGLAVPAGTVQADPVKPPTTEVQGPKPAEPLALVAGGDIQAVRDQYSFASSLGTYTEITGGTQHGSGTIDDNNYNAISIGFTFRYNGVDYTQLGINANGFIRFGAAAFTGSCSYTAISSSDVTNCANLVSAQSEDQQGTATATLRSELLGTSPNQVFVIQWKDFRHYGATGELYNYQIRLYESSNVVELVYGAYTKNATNRTPQVGIKGPSNADYENRTTTTDWSASTRGTANTATMALTTTVYPASGLTYTWTPPPPAANFTTSTKVAPAEAIVGDPITYTINITNSGDLASTATHMFDLIPEGTAYIAGSLACSSGTCSYDGANDQVIWDGAVAIAETVTVSFQVDPTGLPCGSLVSNTAVIEDASALPPSVSKSVTTRMVSELLVLTPLESFDDVTFPPVGWVQTPLVGASVWDRVTAGTSPVIAPHSGAGMARWNAYNITNGNATRLATPTLTLPAETPYNLVFFMSHDTGYSGNNDRIEMQISTDDGATWNDMGITFSRYDPTFTTPGWKMHIVPLAAYAGQTQVQVGFKAVSAYGNNIFVDDVSFVSAGYPCPCAITSSVANACQAQSAAHALTLTCGTAQTVDLALLGNTWPATVEPASVAVPAGGSVEVTVSVDVPFAAALWDMDELTVTAAPQSTPDAFTTSAVQTGFTGLDGDWTTVAPLPAGRVFAAEAITDEAVFVIGGTSDAAGAVEVTTNYRYDIAADTWSEVTPMPVAASQISAAVLDGKIYIPGAYPAGVWDANTYVYDIAADSWSTIPASGTFVGAIFYGITADETTGTLYRLGGIIDDGAGGLVSTNRAWALDVAAGTWTELPPMQVSRMNLSVSMIGGQLYAAGGVAYPGFASTPVTEIFDGATWTYGAPVPTGGTLNGWTYGAYGAGLDSLFLFGGKRDTAWAMLNHTGMYHPAYDQWLTTPALPTLSQARVYLGGGSNSTTLWATGGRDSAGTTLYDTHERLNLCVPAAAGVVLTPETDAKLGEPGTDVTYTLTLENTGNVTDVFNYALGYNWPTALDPAGPITLDPGATQEISATVSIPANAVDLQNDTAAVMYWSTNDPAVFDDAALTTTAVEEPLFTKTAPAEAQVGDVITYTLTLEPYDLFTASITDEIPDGMEYVADSLAVTPDMGTYGYDVGNNTIFWNYTPGDRPAANTWKPADVHGSGTGPAPLVSSPRTTPKAVKQPANTKAVLWDQPLSATNQNALVNQNFTDIPAYSSFLADDFVAASDWTVESIFVPGNGWNGFVSLANATGLTFLIYTDNGGIPAGDPSGAGALPVWALTLTPDDPQITLSNGTGGMPSDTLLTLDTPVNLPAGHYWLVYYPDLPFTGGGQFGRQPADTTNGYTGQFINPGGGFGMGTAWQNWSVLDPSMTQTDIAFRIEGMQVVSEPLTISFDVTVTAPKGALITNTAALAYAGLYNLTASADTLVVNSAPVAVNDAYTMDEDSVLTVAAPGVLVNDTDADSDPLTAVIVVETAHGSVALSDDGSFVYTPDPDFFGEDSFTYKANDGDLDSNVATVTITVENVVPVAVNDAYTMDEDTILNITAPGVLANDTDGDGDALTAVLETGPTYGALTLNADGSFVYTPAPNFFGEDSFTYKANDGTADSNIATVTITVYDVPEIRHIFLPVIMR